MLDETSTQSDVEHLVATTDGKQGKVTLERTINEGELKVVTAIVASPVPGIVDLAISVGTHITSSDDHQAIESIQEPRCDRLRYSQVISTGCITDG